MQGIQLALQLPAKRLGGVGILNKQDEKELGIAAYKIFCFMLDGRWHSSDEIILVSGQREGLRRMRSIRSLDGYDIERRRAGEGRVWEYRLIKTSSSILVK